MKKELVTMPEMKVVGISIRTNNANEINAKTAKISETAQLYFNMNIPDQIPARKKPGTTFAIYLDYENAIYGDYTFFIGEEVSSFDNLPPGLEKAIIPASKYQKFTTDQGEMPGVVINAWTKIWKMSDKEMGGERAFQADFEVYDERANNPKKTSLDIYIGIK